MIQKDTYQIFGINVQSEIELPAPKVEDANPDAAIELGNIPYPPSDFIAKGACFYAKKNEIFFEILGIARYYIVLGKKIIIDIFPGADIDAVKLFLNGPVFGALLLQRNILPMHASAFEYKGKAILLAGNSGIGKSTLIAYLAQKGFRIIADDISAIQKKDSSVIVFASGNYLKIWKNTAQQLNIDTNGLKKARLKLEKYLLPIDTHQQYWPIEKVYILKSHNQAQFYIKELKGSEKFIAIKDNTYRKIFIKGLELEKEFFTKSMELALSIPISELTRPNLGFDLEGLARHLLDDISKND